MNIHRCAREHNTLILCVRSPWTLTYVITYFKPIILVLTVINRRLSYTAYHIPFFISRSFSAAKQYRTSYICAFLIHMSFTYFLKILCTMFVSVYNFMSEDYRYAIFCASLLRKAIWTYVQRFTIPKYPLLYHGNTHENRPSLSNSDNYQLV